MSTAAPLSNALKIECEDRPEWLDNRRNGCGASDSSAILNVGFAGSSTHTVFCDKVYGSNGYAEDLLMAKSLKIGLMMEPVLRDIFADETGLPCESAGQFTIYRHPEIPIMTATLDGWTEDETGACPVELKNVGSFARADWLDEPPLKYQVQVQHQLAVTGCQRGYLFGLIGGNEPMTVIIDRNEDFIDALRVKLEEFWGYVQRKELPPMDGSAGASRVLSQLYPHDSGVTVALPAELTQVHEDMVDAKADMKDAEGRKKLAENMIKAGIGDATFGEIPGVDGYYSWKEQSRIVKCPHCREITSEAHFRTLRKVKKNR